MASVDAKILRKMIDVGLQVGAMMAGFYESAVANGVPQDAACWIHLWFFLIPNINRTLYQCFFDTRINISWTIHFQC